MRIKISKRKHPIIEHMADFLSRYLKRHRTQLLVAAVVFYSLLLFLAGILVHKTEVIEQRIKPAIKNKRVFLKHLARGIFLARPERITIDIAHTDFQKLEYKRQQALEMNKLVVGASDYVPASIRYKDKNIRVNLRLKGDHTDHLEGDKWSFRIKVRGDETLFGMKVFSIQHPKTRNYIHEWLYHKALKREDLISLRYDFIDVTLNGKDLGIYAMEEFFEKRLIEHNGYREGPIIRFDESIMWEELLQRGEIVDSGSYLSSAIDAFQATRTLEDPVKRLQFIRAMTLLESFRNGELKAREVFDTKKLARFFAISDLMGAQHATIWMNMRFYFNPITSRLEPIGFDGNSGIPIDSLCLISDEAYTGRKQISVLESFYATLISDKVFFKNYIKELERISGPLYLDSFFNDVEDELKKKLDIIYREFPYYNFSKDVFHHNQHIIKVSLDPVKTVNVYFKKAHSDSIELELGNTQSMDVEVGGAVYKNSAVLRPSRRIVLPGKPASVPVKYQNVKFLFPENFRWEGKELSDLKLNCRIFGTGQERYETVFPFIHLDKYYIDNDFVRQRPNVHEFDFIVVNKATKRIIVKPGKWDLIKNLIIPKDFTVICSEGTEINLSNSAKILSFSPLLFLGTEEDPVVIYSGDSKGEGIVVMSDGAGSILKNVIFKNLSAPDEGKAGLTGAVTFYESPVDIYQCQFIRNRAEDGLNIIRSEFSIDKTLFTHAIYDGFDADFANGKIIDSSFIQCGNDAIDVSGTVCEIENVFIEGAGDKAISVGEMSNVTLNNAEIKKSNIAVASKDLSVVDMRNVDIFDCNIGFAVYEKKSEYGPGKIIIEFLKAKDIGEMYLVEEGSSITVDKTIVTPNKKDVYELLYGDKG